MGQSDRQTDMRQTQDRQTDRQVLVPLYPEREDKRDRLDKLEVSCKTDRHGKFSKIDRRWTDRHWSPCILREDERDQLTSQNEATKSQNLYVINTGALRVFFWLLLLFN